MATSSEASVPRYVGAAFVAQFVTSLAAGLLSTPALSGGVGNVLAAGADATRLRAVVLLELLTGVGIIALTSLLYVALRDTVRWVATVAFALWLAEATVLAASMLGLYALLDLGGTSVGSGSAVSASDTVVGKFAIGLHEHAADIGMLLRVRCSGTPCSFARGSSRGGSASGVSRRSHWSVSEPCSPCGTGTCIRRSCSTPPTCPTSSSSGSGSSRDPVLDDRQGLGWAYFRAVDSHVPRSTGRFGAIGCN